MILEFKILIYWIFLVVLFGIASFLEYKKSNTSLLYKYYEDGFTVIFKFILVAGVVVLSIYLFCGLTKLWFKNEWVTLLDSL